MSEFEWNASGFGMMRLAEELKYLGVLIMSEERMESDIDRWMGEDATVM